MWKDDETDVEEEVNTPWAIHAMVTFKSRPLPWILSSVYASPRSGEKKESFAEVTSLGHDCNFPYIATLGNVMEVGNMIDLPSSRVEFTWNNRQEGQQISKRNWIIA